ncbi:PilZ domain-containing protein [Fundidesulfovibrio soli]|uniref:PilZ domain-containing protein n=1 Tax=Fundidesulfovibrio soli TaxID=2922716 RepID=UPI001FAFD15A|nr:PilZ domain-containing protein [Fundidesulfovibrio soli]
MNELEFSYEGDANEHRKAFRASMPGLVALAAGMPEPYHVGDVSAGGISLADPRSLLQPGDERELDLVCKGRKLISGLAARVARRNGELAGLTFTDLTLIQEQKLDKLVLEVQKYQITQSKNRGCHIDDEHAT